MKKSGRGIGWSIRGRSRRKKIIDNLIHLPDDIVDPEKIAVYSGPDESDVWPAIYLADILEKAYSNVHMTIICRRRDGEIFNMLKWRPRVHYYESNPVMPKLTDEETFTDRTLLFYPYTTLHDSAVSLLSNSAAGIRVAPLRTDSPLINLKVCTDSDSYPEVLHQLCGTLGIRYTTDWKPLIQHQVHDHASEIMAPISGRSMPYFVTSFGALTILEKNRAEIPLRTVSLAGKTQDFSDLSREVRTAIIAGASAVATDSADLWGDACALGVPVVGLDTSGSFMKWDKCRTSSNTTGFLEAWSALLRTGW